jgi:Ca2+-binding RTX toxin-like protein
MMAGILKRTAAAAALVVLILAVAGSAAGSKAPKCSIRGTGGPDRIVGTRHRDVICGLGDGDEIHGGGGNDVILGGAGDDAIYGDGGRDRLFGGTGNDTFLARDGKRDAIDGGPARDRGLLDRDRTKSVEERFSRRREGDVVALAAGDIASCAARGDDATAILLDLFPRATVATLGDNAYDHGSPSDFAKCYGPTWGRAKARTHPSIGDHEYDTSAGSGYFGYFGAAAGNPATAYYSYDLGNWHVVVLNTSCAEVGGCGAHSAEAQWLRADLTAHPARCTLVYGHRALFSSSNKAASALRPFWQILYDAGADVVLAGNNHVYERFAPQTPAGAPDPSRGLREFVVGTGGQSHGSFGTVEAQSEVRNRETFGVLALTLNSASYSWRFVPVAGKTFSDRGSSACH